MKLIITLSLISLLPLLTSGQSENCYTLKKLNTVLYEPTPKQYAHTAYKEGLHFYQAPDDFDKSELKKRIKKRVYRQTKKLSDKQKSRIQNIVNKYRAFILINSTDSIFQFPHVNNTISVIQEVKDKYGKWIAVETYPMEYCGNTHHGMISLKQNEYVEIYVHRYCGEVEAKFRLKLDAKCSTLYSQEYLGYINPNIIN